MAHATTNESPTDDVDLLKENRTLKRQLRSMESLLQRNKAMLAARTNVNTLLTSQQEKMEQNLNLLLENSPDIILLFDQSGNFTYCTKTFLTAARIANAGLISGHPFAEVFQNFVSPEQLQQLQNNFDIAMSRHSAVVIDDEISFPGQDAPHIYKIHISPMLGDGGKAQGALMLFHDLTDIVRAKEAAEKANNAKSEFLSTMSHEMRTPLNAIIGMTHISRSTDNPEKKEQALEKIESASINLLGVINDILDMSKIESGRLELSEEHFEFAQVLAGASGVVTHSMEQKKQRFIKNMDPDIPHWLYGDRQRLTQVVLNLLSNAVKFTPEGGKILLEAELSERRDDACRIRIRVRDSGIGISKEHQKKLFRSFMQADSSVSRRFGGTGLGLAISKSIVEMMEGEIGVESEENRGASFTFTVWMKLSDRNETAAESPEPALLDYNGLFAGRRVLIVEDIEINQEIVIALLEPTGVAIDTANNGSAALRMFEKNAGAYDLILMDIHMPEMDGYEAARRIRAHSLPLGQSIPIIAMTANAFQEDIDRCLAAGMNDHLSKPIMVDRMIHCMRKYLP